MGRSRTPIVALTAHAMKDVEAEFRAAEMDGHVSKPSRPDALFQTLDNLLALPRA